MNKYVNIDDVYSLLETYNLSPKLGSEDKYRSSSNRFIGNRPKGIILSDTYNHPLFPIDYPKIDSSKAMISKIYNRFRNLYAKSSIKFLPYHFIVEMIDGEYIVYNTRPIDKRFPINLKELKQYIKDKKIKVEKDLQYILSNNIEIQEFIHVAIIGDTNTDIYTIPIYELIGYNCCQSIMKCYKQQIIKDVNFFSMNIGSKFFIKVLQRYF